MTADLDGSAGLTADLDESAGMTAVSRVSCVCVIKLLLYLTFNDIILLETRISESQPSRQKHTLTVYVKGLLLTCFVVRIKWG